jgi:hypothetical protein
LQPRNGHDGQYQDNHVNKQTDNGNGQDDRRGPFGVARHEQLAWSWRRIVEHDDGEAKVHCAGENEPHDRADAHPLELVEELQIEYKEGALEEAEGGRRRHGQHVRGHHEVWRERIEHAQIPHVSSHATGFCGPFVGGVVDEGADETDE